MELTNPAQANLIFGHRDTNLRMIERILEVRIGVRGTQITIKGHEDDVRTAELSLSQLYKIVGMGMTLSSADVARAVELISQDSEIDLTKVYGDIVFRSPQKTVRPKGLTQKMYVEAIRRNDVVFGVGPAGTGKTY